MKISGHRLAPLLGIAAMATIAASASADPQGQPGQAQPQAQPEARAAQGAQKPQPATPQAKPESATTGDKMKERRADPKAAREELGAGKKEEKAAEATKADERLAGLRKTRDERKKEHIDKLHKRWGHTMLTQASVQAELKTHAWRIARLNRIKALAETSEKKNKNKLLDRLNKLIEKELARHDKHMANLQSQHGGTAEPAGHQPGMPEGAGKAGQAPGMQQGVGKPGQAPGKALGKPAEPPAATPKAGEK